MEQRYIRVTDAIAEGLLPITLPTVHRWIRDGVNSEIFIKFGGLLYLDTKKLEDLFERSRLSNNVRS